MVSIFKENSDGSFYCAECRMSFGEPHSYCPYCGSIVSNYETLVSSANAIDDVELTERQKELLRQLGQAVQELQVSINEEQTGKVEIVI